MKLRKVLAGGTAAALLVAASAPAFAANVDTTTTDVGVGFTTYTPSPTNGPLQIAWTPQTFDFGYSHAVPGAAATYAEVTATDMYVVVSDDRAATGAGNEWKLEATLGNLTEQTSGAVLTGATIDFNASLSKGDLTIAPDAGGISAATGTETAIIPAASFSLQQGISANVMQDGDLGTLTDAQTTESAFGMDTIELAVPATAAASISAGDVYEGQITWALDDVI